MPAMMLTKKESALLKCAEMILADQCPPDRKHYLYMKQEDDTGDEYLNHALKISVHSGQLPYTTDDISHKIQSFMRKLQQNPTIVSNLFLNPSLSYIYPQE